MQVNKCTDQLIILHSPSPRSNLPSGSAFLVPMRVHSDLGQGQPVQICQLLAYFSKYKFSSNFSVIEKD